MTDTAAFLRVQVALFLLFAAIVCAGILALLGQASPQLSVPASLLLTEGGALSYFLTASTLFALLTHRRTLRWFSATMLLGYGALWLVFNLLLGVSDWAPPTLITRFWLDVLPAVLIVLFGWAALLGLSHPVGRALAAGVGTVTLVAGAYILMRYFGAASSLEDAPIVLGFTPISGFFNMGFGLALLVLTFYEGRVKLTLTRGALWTGSLGVSGTFVLLVFAAWGAQQERQREARLVVEHQASMLRHELESSAELIERLAYRWSALELAVPEPLRQIELQRYFDDIPALHALLVQDGMERPPLLAEGRSVLDASWLQSQLATQQLRQWQQRVIERQMTPCWVLQEENDFLRAILLVVPDMPARGLFVATFDLGLMLEPVMEIAQRNFEVLLQPIPEASAEPPAVINGHPRAVRERIVLAMHNGPEIALTATAMPQAVLSYGGALIPALSVSGMLVSYLLMMARSLSVLQRQNTYDLSVSEQRYRSLFFQTPEAVFEFSPQGHYLSVNDRAKTITGITDDDLGKLRYQDLLTAEAMSERDFIRFDEAFRATLDGIPQTFEVQFLNRQGVVGNYECAFVPILVDGDVVGLYAVAKDVTERFLAQENQRLLTKSLESSDNAVLVLDVRQPSMPAVFVNSAFADMTGYDKEDVLARSFDTITAPMEGSEELRLVREAIAQGEASSLIIKSYRRGGTPFWNQVYLAPVKDEDGAVTHFTVIMKDVSEKEEQERRMAWQATHDVLTGLANRSLLEDRLQHDIALAQANEEHLALLFIDLDEFKPINDSLGHRVGDKVLISIAQRLRGMVRPVDTLARFGGDEFILLLPRLQSQLEAERIAEQVLQEISLPHQIGEHELYVTASIGISHLSDELEYPEKLLQQADMAMYKAKQQGRDTCVVYSGDLDDKLARRVSLRNELQEAIKSNQLYLNYQPQVDSEGRIIGIEALVRWRHPVKGVVSPGDFIPLAEETGQIVQLGHWILQRACADARRLLQRGSHHGRMAVNISALQFHRAGFLEALQRVLQETGLPASALELELTESILMHNSEAAIATLQDLKAMGLTTSIDDFGTGFSSFSYLKHLPVESVKIDRGFVDQVTVNRKDAAVCKGIITMAGEMGIKVVAEGVETREQFELLRSYGCEAFQGYYFARPMGFEQLLEWISERGV